MAEVTELRPELLAQIRSLISPDQKSQTRRRESRAFSKNRIPFLLTCEQWIGENRYIELFVNPAEVAITLGLRAADQKTKTGTIRHVWHDKRRRTFFDEPQAAFQFQSGNIAPGSRQDVDILRSEPMPGMKDYYDFLELVGTNPMLDDGRENFLYFHTNSRIFPSLVLIGYVKPEGVSHTDSSEDGNSIKWSATMEVHSTFPAVDNSAQLQQTFRDMAIRIGLNNTQRSLSTNPSIPPVT